MRIGLWMAAWALATALAGGEEDAARNKAKGEIVEAEKAAQKNSPEAGERLARAIAEYLPLLEDEMRSKKREKGAKSAAEALAAERDELETRLAALWSPSARFVRAPGGTRWERLEKGPLAAGEYMEAATIDRAALSERLQLRRRSWQDFRLPDGARSGVLNYDTVKKRFSLHLAADREVAFFFLLRSPRAQPVRLAVRPEGREDEILLAAVNGQPLAVPGRPAPIQTTARFLPGANLLLVVFANRGSPLLEAALTVEGEGLERPDRFAPPTAKK